MKKTLKHWLQISLSFLVTHGKLTITTELVKAISSEKNGDKGDVRIVHGLKLNPGVCAIPCCFVKEILEGLQNLFQEVSLDKSGFKHFSSLSSFRTVKLLRALMRLRSRAENLCGKTATQ